MEIKKCDSCKYYGSPSDTDKKDCMYELDKDIDEDGFVIDEPPCMRG